jgi:SAM-dependent methyltransferase
MMSAVDLPDAVDPLRHNRDLWAWVSGEHADAEAARRWATDEIGWGLFQVPERRLGVLGDLRGVDVCELGCGTASLAAKAARRGARVVGVDLSREQLATARRCQVAFGPVFPLVEATGEVVPLRSGSFDLVVSDYGVAPWCDPARWVPEAARLLRPGGRLVFLTNSVLAGLCVPAEGGVAGDRLLRAQQELRRVEWPGGGIEHHLGHGDWIREMRSAGLRVEALHELRADDGDADPDWYEIVTADWARAWPAEDLWVASRA